MDNVSHTIAGLLLAEAAVQLRSQRGEPPSPGFARAAYWVSAVANNLPDADFLYSRITSPPTLGYLLHHRGHTHTLLVALLLGALFGLAWQAAAGRGGARRPSHERTWLLGLALLGAVVHIAMDFTNNYGVHPFWPVHRGWFYGDFVFIIEPLFFAIGVPPLLASFQSRAARVLFALVLAAVLAAAWAMPWVPPGTAVFVSAVTLLSLWLARTLPPARRIALTFAAALVVVLVFGGARFAARTSALASLPAAAALQDLVLTPMPGNPLCWAAWRVSSQAGDYVAERGAVAAFPALHPVEHCRIEPNAGATTAPVVELDVRESPSVRWTGRYRAAARELADFQRRNCQVAAFLRYARVPYWNESGGELVIGDLRYDRAPDIEFAELDLPLTREQGCPRWVPDWTPPRDELLRRANGS